MDTFLKHFNVILFGKTGVKLFTCYSVQNRFLDFFVWMKNLENTSPVVSNTNNPSLFSTLWPTDFSSFNEDMSG